MTVLNAALATECHLIFNSTNGDPYTITVTNDNTLPIWFSCFDPTGALSTKNNDAHISVTGSKQLNALQFAAVPVIGQATVTLTPMNQSGMGVELMLFLCCSDASISGTQVTFQLMPYAKATCGVYIGNVPGTKTLGPDDPSISLPWYST